VFLWRDTNDEQGGNGGGGGWSSSASASASSLFCMGFVFMAPTTSTSYYPLKKSIRSPRATTNTVRRLKHDDENENDSFETETEHEFDEFDENENEFDNICAAVIVPGFLTGEDEFQSMCQSLTEKGIPTVAVKMPNWHWLPSLGGRSARPILERIDYTVQHVIAHFDNNNDDEHNDKPDNNKVHEIVIPPYDYSLWDLYQDFRDNPGGAMKVGGSSRVEFYPDVEPKGKFQYPIPTISKNNNNNNNNNNTSTSTSTSTSTKTKKKKKIALIGHRYVT